MPLSVRIGLLIILLALAVALGLTALRAQRGRLRRKGLSGVRTPTAMLDDRRFSVANRAATPFLFVGSALALVLAVLVGTTSMNWAGGSFGVLLVGVVIGATLVGGGMRGERAAKRDLAANPSVSRSPTGRGGRSAAPPRARVAAPARPRGRVSGRGGGPRRPSR